MPSTISRHLNRDRTAGRFDYQQNPLYLELLTRNSGQISPNVLLNLGCCVLDLTLYLIFVPRKVSYMAFTQNVLPIYTNCTDYCQ